MKICAKCNTEKPLSSFVRNKNGKNGLHCYCKYCMNLLSKTWRDKNKEYQRNYNYTLLYGITLEEYNRMYSLQNGSCGICFNKTKKLYVDHCHSTGKVRKLLCNRCNVAVGFMEDKNIVKAINDYLEETLC